MKLFKSKKAVAIGVTAGLVLGIAGGAFAFFTTTGNGTGSASVGTATNKWQVTVNSDTTHAIYPANGSETVAYSIKNISGGNLNLNSVTVSVVADVSGDIKASGVSVPGCKAVWFTATDNGSSPGLGTYAANAVDNGSLTVAMVESDSNQDACQGASGPDVNVAAA